MSYSAAPVDKPPGPGWAAVRAPRARPLVVVRREPRRATRCRTASRVARRRCTCVFPSCVASRTPSALSSRSSTWTGYRALPGGRRGEVGDLVAKGAVPRPPVKVLGSGEVRAGSAGHRSRLFSSAKEKIAAPAARPPSSESSTCRVGLEEPADMTVQMSQAVPVQRMSGRQTLLHAPSAVLVPVVLPPAGGSSCSPRSLGRSVRLTCAARSVLAGDHGAVTAWARSSRRRASPTRDPDLHRQRQGQQSLRPDQPVQRWRAAAAVGLRARDHAVHHREHHLQLLTVVIPRFEALKKEGQSGTAKLTQYTRYLTIGLAVLQSTGLSRSPAARAAFPGLHETTSSTRRHRHHRHRHR